MNYIHINKLLTKSIYKQIADSIHQAIESGVLSYNDKLPTEKEICHTFRVSQTAVKMAYELLIGEGLIKRIKGKGTYVLNRPTYHQKLDSFFACEIEPYITKKVLMLDRTNKDLSVMRELGLDSKEKYLTIMTLFSNNDNPVVLQRAYLPLAMFDGLLEGYDDSKSLYQLLENRKEVLELRSTFSPINASASDALLLNVMPDDALYLVRTKVVNEKDEVVAYIANFYPGEFTEFEVDVYAR